MDRNWAANFELWMFYALARRRAMRLAFRRLSIGWCKAVVLVGMRDTAAKSLLEVAFEPCASALRFRVAASRRDPVARRVRGDSPTAFSHVVCTKLRSRTPRRIRRKPGSFLAGDLSTLRRPGARRSPAPQRGAGIYADRLSYVAPCVVQAEIETWVSRHHEQSR
jgi:hypothetical protein